MAVREAWQDAVAKRYGYDEDFPAEFGEWMKKQGISADWSKRYWRAHWEVPGPTFAQEMLHRTSMTKDDYKTLLKIADYPSKFRDWMTEVAYAPYTRVDIRRMYRIGVIQTWEELIRSYKDIGYDDDKAEKLAEFTVLEYGEEEKEATKADVLAAYEIARFTKDEAAAMLGEMGYPDWVIEVYLTRTDLKREVRVTAEQIKYVKTQYVNQLYSKSDVYAKLGAIPLAASEIARYLDEWDITREAKTTRPSRTDLRKFFVQNAMSEAELRQELRGYRLSAKYIDWYVEDAKRELVQLAQADAEKARAEAEKIQKSLIKSDADIETADIAIFIADANLAIADLKMSASEDMTLDDLQVVLDTINEYKRLILELRVQKAEVRKAYLESIAPPPPP